MKKRLLSLLFVMICVLGVCGCEITIGGPEAGLYKLEYEEHSRQTEQREQVYIRLNEDGTAEMRDYDSARFIKMEWNTKNIWEWGYESDNTTLSSEDSKLVVSSPGSKLVFVMIEDHAMLEGIPDLPGRYRLDNVGYVGHNHYSKSGSLELYEDGTGIVTDSGYAEILWDAESIRFVENPEVYFDYELNGDILVLSFKDENSESVLEYIYEKR